MKLTATISLAIIAICQLFNTVAVYGADYGGYNLCVGNLYCYHIAQEESGLWTTQQQSIAHDGRNMGAAGQSLSYRGKT